MATFTKIEREMKWIMAILLTFTGLACQSKEPGHNGAVIADRLVSAEAKEVVTAAELKKKYGQLNGYIKNGYTSYRVTYNSTGKDGKPYIASGAIFVPDTNAALPVFNYNHGTYFPSQEREAPSYLGNSYELVMGKLFAGAGYLVIMPDYPGYGASRDMDHPYGAYHEIASSVIDMLYAVREFAAKENIRLSGKNFYSGWSEGAAVAMATIRAIEKNKLNELVPATTVLKAGPYFSSGFVHHVLDAKKPLNYMSTYAWILQSYNSFYDINRPLSYYFKEPAASALAKGPGANIPRLPDQLFTRTFIDNYRTGKDTALKQAFIKNDLWDWKPRSPIVFCHGDRDDYVPIFNSVKAYEAMKAKGAEVSLQVLKGHNHNSGVFDFLRIAFSHFEEAR